MQLLALNHHLHKGKEKNNRLWKIPHNCIFTVKRSLVVGVVVGGNKSIWTTVKTSKIKINQSQNILSDYKQQGRHFNTT